MMDIANIFSKAKEVILEQGNHQPLLLVETKKETYALFSVDLGDTWNSETMQKKMMLFTMGRKFARKERKQSDDILGLALVTEVWMVERQTEEELQDIRVSEQSDKHEGICVLELRIGNKEADGKKSIGQYMHMAEIIRNGETVDLLPKHNNIEAQSSLLMAFLAGVGSGQWNDAEFARKIHRLQSVGEF